MPMRNIKLGSLFDGIGVFPLAAARCHIVPVWASEIEKVPMSITKRHFPNMEHLGDITKIKGGKITPVHIITFGSPCQNLSLAGRREGLSGSKSSLFFEAIRIIREMRGNTNGMYPTFAVWENVYGAFSSNHRMDFKSVLESFAGSEIPIPASNHSHHNKQSGMQPKGRTDNFRQAHPIRNHICLRQIAVWILHRTINQIKQQIMRNVIQH